MNSKQTKPPKPPKQTTATKKAPAPKPNLTISDFIAFNSSEEYDRSIFHFTQMVDGISIKTAKEKLDNVVSTILGKKKNQIFQYTSRGRNSGTFYAFDTGFKFQNGAERIFAYTMKNTRREAERTHEYYGLFFERASMLRDDVLSKTNKWHIGDIVFDDLESMNALLSKLAEEAFYENWTFPNYQSIVKHPILKNYIENTYFQLVSEEKVYINEQEEKMLINTGLIDRSFNEIFLVCDIIINTKKDKLFNSQYSNPDIYKSSDRVFSNYSRNQPLHLARFYDKPGDLLFDWEIAQQPGGINIADEHIFVDNMVRINQGLRNSQNSFNFQKNSDVTRCRQMFEGALKASLELCKRNYKFVAPQFWPATGKIQFLMPVYLEGIQEIKQGEQTEVLPPTVALSLELVHGQYIGTTILTLDMAYQNARLIARPDGFWLDSTKIFTSKAND